MKYKCAALWLGLSVTSLFAENPVRRPAQSVQTNRIDFPAGGTIRMDRSFGDLYIEGWDQPAVEMTLIKEMRKYDTAKNVSEKLERVQLIAEHPSPTELSISTSIPSRSFFLHPTGGKGDVTVRYELHVPRNSHLILHHGGGDILISNVVGGIDATNRNGDVVLWLPGTGPYSIDAKSGMGTVTSDFSGQTHVRHFIGEGFAEAGQATTNPIHVHVAIGGITIKAISPEARP